EGERWGHKTVTLVNPVDLGAALTSEGTTNPTVVLPSWHDLTNAAPESFRSRSFPRHEPRPEQTNDLGAASAPRVEREGPPRDGEGRPRRPFGLRNMDEKEYQSLIQKRALHGLVLGMSTDS